MKKLHSLPLVAVLFSVATCKAQPECSGIYLTANDFKEGKMYYACSSRSNSKNSYLNLLAKSHFFIIHPDFAWQRINKEDVFAIKGCDGEITRICHGTNYYLLNPAERIPIYKVLLNPVCKGSISRVKYCFSKDLESEIMELTINNVKAAFTDNLEFNKAIETYFKDDNDLYSYNHINNCFELNSVFNNCK